MIARAPATQRFSGYATRVKELEKPNKEGMFNDDLAVTHRGVEDYLPMVPDTETYPMSWMHPESLSGLKLMDVCCGKGVFVRQLTEGVNFTERENFPDRLGMTYHGFWSNLAMYAQKEAKRTRFFDWLRWGGVQIKGIDHKLPAHLEKDPRFMPGDIRRLWRIRDNTVDGVYSAWGPFSFDPKTTRDERDCITSLKELTRIIKPRTGFIRLGKVMDWGYLRSFVRHVPHLSLKQLVYTSPESLTPDELVAAELAKTP